ncbi:hypothetical protein TNCV_3860181 [Trichonephila clavipes]|nr:hypothetical protein TNCV_3860181 [Trichonephila clavipes]
MADCEVEGTIASPLSIPLERAMSPTGERSDEGTSELENPFGPQERQTRIDRALEKGGVMMAGDMAGTRWSGEVPALDVCKSGRTPLSKIWVRSFFIPHLITLKSWSRTICFLLDFASDWSKQSAK